MITNDKLEGLIWQPIQAYNFDYNLEKNEIYEAIDEIDKAIKLDPKNIDLYFSKSKILYENGEYKQVLDFLDKMVLEFPQEEKNIKVKIAYVLKEMKNAKAGLDIINGLLEKYPEDNDLLNYKAFWLQFLNRKEESIEIIQKLIARVPDNATYHDTYGEILMFFKEYEKAIEEFLKTIKIGRDNWYVYQTNIKLGICYKELENYQQAVEYLQKGKELTDKALSDLDERAKWITIANLFLAEIEQLKADF